jgi:hypothetical protein
MVIIKLLSRLKRGEGKRVRVAQTKRDGHGEPSLQCNKTCVLPSQITPAGRHLEQLFRPAQESRARLRAIVGIVRVTGHELAAAMLTDNAPTEVLYADLQVAAASRALLHEISGLRHGGISLHPYVYVPGEDGVIVHKGQGQFNIIPGTSWISNWNT